jgi:hypothetical protein
MKGGESAAMETEHHQAKPAAKTPEEKNRVRFGHVVSWRAEPLDGNQMPTVEQTDPSRVETFE